MNRGSLTFTILTVLACAAAPTPVHTPSDKTTAARSLEAVSVADGVSREEAEAIASYFFYYHAGVGCGAPDLIREARGSWRVTTRLGYAGDPGDDILISKVDGSVTWGTRRCVQDPLSMLSSEGESSSCLQ